MIKKVLLSTLLVCTAHFALCKSSYASEQPNVVLILIDDLSYFGISAYGATKISSTQDHFTDVPYSTPRIDQLAEEGILCEYAFTHAVCEPTRIALMTGMHNGRNYVQTKALHESQITFGDLFTKAGYATGMYGKWKQSRGTPIINGKKYISEFGWDDYACFDVTTEGQRYINPNLVINDVAANYTGRTDVDPRTGRRWFGPDICNYKALDFIEEHKDEPFFLYYPMILIHDDHKPTPDTEPASVFDNIAEGHRGTENDHRQYVPDMLFYMDKLIGKVVDKLEEVGVRDNTLIIFMGDNGCKEFIQFTLEDGTKLRGGKGRTNFHGEQVPMIMSMPSKIAKGETYSGIVDLTDIFPTMFDACGIEIPEFHKVDGVSLWPQLTGTEGNHRPYNALYRWHNAFKPMTDLSEMVRFAQTPQFKYYAPHDMFPNGRFFDLRQDLYEKQGALGKTIGWENYWYTGIDQNALTSEQDSAYKILKHIVDSMDYQSVESITIGGETAVAVDEQIQLTYTNIPENTTLSGVVWVSSNTSVATVNKWGVVTGKKDGVVTISAYSWDDAHPVADNGNPIFKTTGEKGEIEITVGASDPPKESNIEAYNMLTDEIIFPNPAKNVITISNTAPGEYLSLLDMNGKELSCFVVQSDNSSLFVENLNNGWYFIKSSSGKVYRFLKE